MVSIYFVKDCSLNIRLSTYKAWLAMFLVPQVSITFFKRRLFLFAIFSINLVSSSIAFCFSRSTVYDETKKPRFSSISFELKMKDRQNFILDACRQKNHKKNSKDIKILIVNKLNRPESTSVELNSSNWRNYLAKLER